MIAVCYRLQNRRKVKWMDEDSQSRVDDADLLELHLKDSRNSKIECSGQKRPAKV